MKKLLTLGAGAILAALVLFSAPQQAHAQVACSPVTGGANVWPYENGTTAYVQYCGTAGSTNGTIVTSALNNLITGDLPAGITANQAGNILANYTTGIGGPGSKIGARFFVFGTQNEFSNTDQGETIGGTIHTGDTITITITDPNLTGSPLVATYTTISADDTLAKIATKVAAKVQLLHTNSPDNGVNVWHTVTSCQLVRYWDCDLCAVPLPAPGIL